MNTEQEREIAQLRLWDALRDIGYEGEHLVDTYMEVIDPLAHGVNWWRVKYPEEYAELMAGEQTQ